MSETALKRASTRAAEGLDRRSFTVHDVLRMRECGIIGEDENFELVEGEIVPVSPKSHVHELIKSAIMLLLARALPDYLWLGVESTMYLSDRTLLEPDLVIYRRGLKLEEVTGGDMILAIEVALTTLAFDNGLKARLYASHGVQELWVVDAKRRLTFIHSGATPDGWSTVRECRGEEPLLCDAVPGFAVRLADI